MFTSELHPVIIDFDSCQALGAKMEGKEGTPGYSRDSDYSEIENDMFGLQKVEEFIREKLQRGT